MKQLKLTALILTGLVFTALPGIADDIIIIHRSGKIQTIQIDGVSDPIEQVSFRRGKDTQSQVQVTPPTGTAPAPGAVSAVKTPDSPPKLAEEAKSATKSNIKVKWATPVDSAQY